MKVIIAPMRENLLIQVERMKKCWVWDGLTTFCHPLRGKDETNKGGKIMRVLREQK